MKLPNSKKVLAFNPARTLVAVFRSVRAAAEISKSQPQAISNCCNGKVITASGYYWRHLPVDIDLEGDDIGSLTLKEFDELAGIQREYVDTRKIRKRVIKFKNKR